VEEAYGTVFSITTSGTETVLHSFARSGDGEYPYAGAAETASATELSSGKRWETLSRKKGLSVTGRLPLRMEQN